MRAPQLEIATKACMDLNGYVSSTSNEDPKRVDHLAKLCARDSSGRITSIRYLHSIHKSIPTALAKFDPSNMYAEKEKNKNGWTSEEIQQVISDAQKPIMAPGTRQIPPVKIGGG